MVFEEEIPQVPSRDQELKMIKNMEEEFIAQPFYKIYTNEGVRQTKIEFSHKINEYKRKWYKNFCLGIIVSTPIVLLLSRFRHRMMSGVPFIFPHKANPVLLINTKEGMNRELLKFQVPAVLLFSYMFAKIFTNQENLYNYYFTHVKIRKML